MGEDVAPFVEAAFFCCNDEAAVLALPALHGEAGNFQVAFGNFGRGRGSEQGAVLHGGQRTGGGAQAEAFHFPQERWDVAPQAQAGGEHQECQNRHKPRRGIHIIQAEEAENLMPERPEFHHISHLGLILLQHRADHRSEREQREQRHGKAHGAEKGKPRPPQQRGFGGIGCTHNRKSGAETWD